MSDPRPMETRAIVFRALNAALENQYGSYLLDTPSLEVALDLLGTEKPDLAGVDPTLLVPHIDEWRTRFMPQLIGAEAMAAAIAALLEDLPEEALVAEHLPPDLGKVQITHNQHIVTVLVPKTEATPERWFDITITQKGA